MIDLASRQDASLGYQVMEMNHLVLPHVKNAILEAALAVTQVCMVLGIEHCMNANLTRPYDYMSTHGRNEVLGLSIGATS